MLRIGTYFLPLFNQKIMYLSMYLKKSKGTKKYRLVGDLCLFIQGANTSHY